MSVSTIEKPTVYKCKLCQKEISPLGMPSHVNRMHQMSIKEYYDKYLKQDDEGICLMCGKETAFAGLTKKYKKYCSKECANSSPLRMQHIAETNIKRYGTTCILASKEIRDKISNTNLERYGCENPFAAEEVKEKIRQTNLQRYGTESAAQAESVKQKSRETCLKKYGVEYSFQSENNKQKSKQIMLQKYGVEHNFQRQDIIEISKKASHAPEIDQKRNRKLNKNHTLEIYLQKQLKIEFETEFYSDEYPFCCDLYIPKYDLYVEINNFWTHYRHFFDDTNSEDMEHLAIWKERAKNIKFYKNAIKCWTIDDIHKRDTALKNNLNYVVLWNKEHIDLFTKQINEGKVFVGFNDFNEIETVYN